MKECKHNWIEAAWAKAFAERRVNAGREYFFQCTRCSESRFVALVRGGQ